MTLLLVTGFLAGFGAIAAMLFLARKLNFLDHPAHRKNHIAPVPLLGGLGVFIGAAAAVFSVMPETRVWQAAASERMVWIVAPTLAALLLGLFDDKFNLRARYKFLGQLLIVLPFVVFGFHFKVLQLPGALPWTMRILSIPFTALWMLALINGVNMIDGADGLAGAVGLAMSVMTGLVAYYIGDEAVSTLSLAVASSLLAFLLFNWRPARIYMGDSGTMALGVFLATSLVSLGQQPSMFSMPLTNGVQPFPFQIPLVTAIAAYPLMEVSLSTFRRWLRGKSIAAADRGHIHHRLLARGWPAHYISSMAGLIALLGGAIALSAIEQQHGVLSWLLCLIGVLVGYGIHFCGFMRQFHPKSIQDDRPHFLIANHFAQMQKIKLDLAETLDQVLMLVNQTCVEFDVHSYKLTLSGASQDAGDFTWNWQRPPALRSSLLLPAVVLVNTKTSQTGFADRIVSEGGEGWAEWSFEPHVLEEDIDIEYRVLMSDFMKKVLLTSSNIDYEKDDRARLSEQSAHNIAVISSSHLRRSASRRRRTAQHDVLPKQ